MAVRFTKHTPLKNMSTEAKPQLRGNQIILHKQSQKTAKTVLIEGLQITLNTMIF